MARSFRNSAILFLYDHVLGKKISLVDGVVRAKRPHRLRVVLTGMKLKRWARSAESTRQHSSNGGRVLKKWCASIY